MRNMMHERFAKFLALPACGAVFAAISVFIIFILCAASSGMFSLAGVINWLQVSAQLGILAMGASLLMIAGEFDLSIGSMIGFAGMCLAVMLTVFAIPVSLAIILTFLVALSIGAINGRIVVATGLPSFIVSLAFLFILRGATIGLSRFFADRTLIGGLHDTLANSFLAKLFGAKLGGGLFSFLAQHNLIASLPSGLPVVDGIPVVIFWWLGLSLVGHWLLYSTQFGNWIFSTGGDPKVARTLGVPVNRVKILLFMLTALCATIYALCQVVELGSADSQRGLLKEFEAIIAVVIGGTLLTGGFGSVIGAAIGALIFGVLQIGIFYTGINTDWFRVLLGAMLLAAVLFNHYVRKQLLTSR